MESILMPLNDIAHFEQSLIKVSFTWNFSFQWTFFWPRHLQTLAAIAPYLANMVPEVDESVQRAPRSPIMSPLRGSTNELRRSVNLSQSNNNLGLNVDNGVPTIDEPLLDFGNLTMSGSYSADSSAKNSNNSGPQSHELDMIFGASPPLSNQSNANNSSTQSSEKLIDFDL